MGKKQKSSRTNHFKHLEGISITSNQQKKETIEHQKASITPSKKKSDSLNWRKNDGKEYIYIYIFYIKK